MLRDKKSRGGELRFVLAERIGAVRTVPVPTDLARAALGRVGAVRA